MKLPEIHVHVHYENEEEIVSRLTSIERKLDMLKDDFDKAIADINDATNAEAARVQKLIDRLATGLSAEEAAPVLAELAALRDRLNGIAADPANPVPPTT